MVSTSRSQLCSSGKKVCLGFSMSNRLCLFVRHTLLYCFEPTGKLAPGVPLLLGSVSEDLDPFGTDGKFRRNHCACCC